MTWAAKRTCYICAKKYGPGDYDRQVIPICRDCRHIWDIKEAETPKPDPRPTPRLDLPSRTFADDGALWEDSIG